MTGRIPSPTSFLFPVGFAIAYGLFGRGFLTHWAIEVVVLSVLWGIRGPVLKSWTYRVYSHKLRRLGRAPQPLVFAALDATTAATILITLVLLVGGANKMLGYGAPAWSEADRENAAHIFRAFEYAQDAVEGSSSASPFSVPAEEDMQQELGLLERALQEAEQVDDAFLEHRHAEFRSAFRVLFQKPLQLRIESHRNADWKSLNRAALLFNEWVDWFEDHKREMTLPRPSDVLRDRP